MSAQANLSAWLRDLALPLWTSAGFDARTGLFAERLDGGGEPMLGLPRRAMVQARQIFVVCTAERYGWMAGSGDIALRAGEALLRYHAADDDDGFIFSVDPEGRPLDGRRDLYCQAFCLFALASLIRLDPAGPWRSRAERLLTFIDTRMRHSTAGFVECRPERAGPRRQNPHMHLLEAFHALREAAPGDRAAAMSGEIVNLLETHFLQWPGPSLCEYFDGSLHALHAHRQAFEPGHHFEWAWLLVQHARLTGTTVSPVARQLWDVAVAHGIGPDGMILDEVRTDGSIAAGGTRLWPYAEAIKAAASGIADDAPVSTVQAFATSLSRRFLDPAYPGAWIDHFDGAGQRKSSEAPASSLYHICSAVAALEEAGLAGSDP